jgi:hypothetical protein
MRCFASIASILLLLPFLASGKDRKHVLYLGDGIVSMHQFRGVTHTSKMGLPNNLTGALFLTYRYFFNGNIAAGITAGIDNQRGPLTFGHPNYGGFGGPGGDYARHTQTLAGELLITYIGGEKSTLYGTVGAGYTHARLVKTYDTPTWLDGQTDLPPARQFNIDESGFNFHITMLGFRTRGRSAFFLETGIGYKGVLSAGFSFKP